ncbi:hypothetical protein BaRGS_00001802 [Batillaria attramentaria]|uniref:Uncharacterized protein n=1 Tax=Batillaria attramentaria TaxID=370345 RepID=A0ABD0M5A8_9CAEN
MTHKFWIDDRVFMHVLPGKACMRRRVPAVTSNCQTNGIETHVLPLLTQSSQDRAEKGGGGGYTDIVNAADCGNASNFHTNVLHQNWKWRAGENDTRTINTVIHPAMGLPCFHHQAWLMAALAATQRQVFQLFQKLMNKQSREHCRTQRD